MAARSWRTVDIVVAATVAVVFGVIFWVWGLVPYTSALAFFPPLAGLLNPVFVMAGPLGALIVRKPGAALFTEVVAAMVEALISTTWSSGSILVYGLVQGLAAELAFLLFAYRRFDLPVALLSGLLTSVASGVLDLYVYRYYPTFSAGWQLTYLVALAVGGMVIAGGLAWYLVRALAGTGVLMPFAAGRQQRLV